MNMFLGSAYRDVPETQNGTISDAIKIYSVCKYVVIFSKYEGDVYFGPLDEIPEALLSKNFSCIRMDQQTLYIQL
jgi:hypothetical protein